MIKTYCKMATIRAEQFDGSKEMMKKYRLIDGSDAFRFNSHIDPEKVYISTIEGNLEVNICDWIATGVKGENWLITDDVFKKTYTKLPVIPKLIAKYIVDMKSQGDDIWDTMHHFIRDDNLAEYMEDNSETFARAWLDGYLVEEKNEIQ